MATELAYDVKLALAEESSGITTKAEMVETLTAMAARNPAVVGHR